MSTRRQTAGVRAITLVLGGVALAAVVVAAVLAVSSPPPPLLATAAVLLSLTASQWLPVKWVPRGEATAIQTAGPAWVGAGVALLPGPALVLVAAVAHVLGWVLTCQFGNGVHRPRYDVTAGAANLAIGALPALPAIGVAALVPSPLAAAAVGALVFWLAADGIVAAVDAVVGGGSALRTWRGLVADTAPVAIGSIVTASLIVVTTAEFGPRWPALVVTAVLAALWWQAATLHHYRTVTATLLELSTSATSAGSVQEVRALVADAGRGILGRRVQLLPADVTPDVGGVVATTRVGASGWTLVVGEGAMGRPFGAGPREQRALTGLAAAAEVALVAAEARQQMRDQATHDELTGLLNRRGFNQEAARQLQRAQRAGHETTLAFIDLDGFKHVNDTLGHETGDEVLVAVADSLTEHVRSTDLAARLGGDEFAVLFADELAEETAHHRITSALAGLPHGVTGSVGTVRGESTDLDELVATADRRMYSAKQARRAQAPPQA